VALIAAVGGFVFLRSKSPKQTTIKESITPAQIESLLKANNKLTASRLAKATNTSEEYAKKVLDNMVVDGKLTISTKDSYELVYSGILLP
jgi:predicted HTH transcriptional regulator